MFALLLLVSSLENKEREVEVKDREKKEGWVRIQNERT
jgi:hypothetical protein